MPNGSDNGKETSRKLPVSREKRSPFKVVGWGGALPCRGLHWGRSQEQEERSEGATGWPGLGQAGSSLSARSSARAVWPGPAKGTTEPGPLAASGPWLGGPADVSAPLQRLQLVGHLLQLRLDGQQALQLLVLGENIKGHAGTGRAVWKVQSARLVVPLATVWPPAGGFASLSLRAFIHRGTEMLPYWDYRGLLHRRNGGGNRGPDPIPPLVASDPDPPLPGWLWADTWKMKPHSPPVLLPGLSPQG